MDKNNKTTSMSEEERNREIYEQHIAPLLHQLQIVAREHGFSYIFVVQYNPNETANGCDVSHGARLYLHDAWAVIREAITAQSARS
jgi:hypothetical protein